MAIALVISCVELNCLLIVSVVVDGGAQTLKVVFVGGHLVIVCGLSSVSCIWHALFCIVSLRALSCYVHVCSSIACFACKTKDHTLVACVLKHCVFLLRAKRQITR